MNDSPVTEASPPKRYYRPKEVADLLAVSKRTVYRWIEEGVLPSVRLSDNLVRLPRQEIDEWIEQREQT